jgi:excisionase family DNA binding protein
MHANSRPGTRSQLETDVLDRLLTLAETAQHLRRHPKTVERWAREGKIPYYRIGGRVMFDRGDVLQWVAERRADHCHD